MFSTDAFKTASKRAIEKIVEATGHLIGNKIADAVAKSYSNNKILGTTPSKTILTENTSKIPNERYIQAGKQQQIID